MKTLKKLFAVVLVISVLFTLVGCNNDGSRTSKPKFTSSDGSYDVTAVENERYELSYNCETSALTLRDKTKDFLYSSTIVAEGEDFKNQEILSSSLVVEYVKQLDNNYTALFSCDGANCKQDCKKTKNGLTVTYYFNKAKISVPVEYTLTDKGLTAGVDLNKVAEGGKNMVGKITLLPMFARAENNNESGYLFIPSGSGGISYTKDEITKTGTMDVYGSDLSEVQSMLWTSEKVLMPVFGAKQDKNASMGIIENGAEMASLISSVNDVKMGYSYIYPSFRVRGFNKVVKNTAQAVESFIYNEDIADSKIKVSYYLLDGNNASYSGMADTYKKYLDDKYGKQKKENNAPVLSLKFLGGVEEKKFFFGVPYHSLYPLTTVDEAKEITAELKSKTGETPLIQLVGFGKSGLENKQIAGGYGIASKLGSVKDIVKWQKENTVAIDFDIVNFSKSSNGFSVSSDIAKSTTDDKMEQNYYQVALLSPNKALKGYYLLSRFSLNEAADKLLKSAEKSGINALSMSTLGTVAYSDYGDRKYFAKSGMETQVKDIIAKFKDITVVSNGAFEYVSAMSDYITDAPIQTSKSKIINEEIPFYQMVFGSRVNVYNTAVNLATDDTLAILKAAEAGTGLAYTINKNYSTKLLDSSQNMLYATYYSGVKNRIISQVKEYIEFYNLIKDSTIKEHTVLANGLRKTVYENGVTVYVNYTENTLSDGEITVNANSYKVKEG